MTPNLGFGVHSPPFLRLFYYADLIRYCPNLAGTWIYELLTLAECPNLLLILMSWTSRCESNISMAITKVRCLQPDWATLLAKWGIGLGYCTIHRRKILHFCNVKVISDLT